MFSSGNLSLAMRLKINKNTSNYHNSLTQFDQLGRVRRVELFVQVIQIMEYISYQRMKLKEKGSINEHDQEHNNHR